MKKIQCEMCGSIAIKKIDDTTFECQNCGIQYSKDEIQKHLIKIDRSDEIKNAVKRGEQYESERDWEKAEEYYNQALDMDADNEKILEKLKDVSEQKKIGEYYIVEPQINAKENVKNFLYQLSLKNDIAADIYEEIKITEVTEKYYTLLYNKNKCVLEYSATACHDYFENETVYDKTFNWDRVEFETRPETRSVRKTQRVPVSGKNVYESDGMAFAANEINERIQTGNPQSEQQLLEKFEELQYNKYNSYSVKKINADKLRKEGEQYFFDGMELELAEVDPEAYLEKREKICSAGEEKQADALRAKIGGDYFESFSATRRCLSSENLYVTIPVQIIKYEYKSENYVAISDLISPTDEIVCTYPFDQEAEDEIATIREKKELYKKRRKNLSLLVYCLSTIFAVVLLGIAADDLGHDRLITAMIMAFIIPCILSLFTALRYNSYYKAAIEEEHRFSLKHKASLEKSRERFFNAYTDYALAQNDAADVNAINP